VKKRGGREDPGDLIFGNEAEIGNNINYMGKEMESENNGREPVSKI